MAKEFGADWKGGVFVRSDTNVEDLPGFTGAGLNLTVFNVVGFDNVIKAISAVWASPYTPRAWAWRQAHMSGPENVYPAVLLMQTVPSAKSGVMISQDVDTGDRNVMSVAVNEGVSGAVDGQAAESIRVNLKTGDVKLMATATAPTRLVPLPAGGVATVPATGADTAHATAEIKALIAVRTRFRSNFRNSTSTAHWRQPMWSLRSSTASCGCCRSVRSTRASRRRPMPISWEWTRAWLDQTQR